MLIIRFLLIVLWSASFSFFFIFGSQAFLDWAFSNEKPKDRLAIKIAYPLAVLVVGAALGVAAFLTQTPVTQGVISEPPETLSIPNTQNHDPEAPLPRLRPLPKPKKYSGHLDFDSSNGIEV